jgi:hypothetical protein
MNILIENGTDLDWDFVHGYRSNWIYRFNRAYGLYPSRSRLRNRFHPS